MALLLTATGCGRVLLSRFVSSVSSAPPSPVSPENLVSSDADDISPAVDKSLSVAYFDLKMNQLRHSLALKEDVETLSSVIENQRAIIAKLEEKVNFILGKADESEAYSCRLGSRIEGILLPDNA